MTSANLQSVNEVLDALKRIRTTTVDDAMVERIAATTGVGVEKVKHYLARAGVGVEG